MGSSRARGLLTGLRFGAANRHSALVKVKVANASARSIEKVMNELQRGCGSRSVKRHLAMKQQPLTTISHSRFQIPGNQCGGHRRQPAA